MNLECLLARYSVARAVALGTMMLLSCNVKHPRHLLEHQEDRAETKMAGVPKKDSRRCRTRDIERSHGRLSSHQDTWRGRLFKKASGVKSHEAPDESYPNGILSDEQNPMRYAPALYSPTSLLRLRQAYLH